MPITNMLFDADGVLQTWTPGVLDRLRRLPQKVPAGVELAPETAGSDPAQRLVGGFMQAVFAAEQPCLRGEAVFSERLEPVLDAWGVVEPLADVLPIWHAIEPYVEMFDLITQLRRNGVTCHLATNQQSVRAAYMRSQLGYDALFDSSFYSCDLGVAKPDPVYFERIMATLKVPTEQVLFIDDRQDNVVAAQSVGLHGLQFEARKTPDPVSAFQQAAARWQLPME